MMKPVTGQYECLHSSGVGLNFFTSRIDRLTLQANGRFSLVIQDRSRLANAAQSLVSGQQVTTAAPEIRREGNYTVQGNVISFRFDDGSQEQGQLSWNGDGVQIGKDFFTKVSDSTLLPPTHRVKKDMDDIAKGLKIAGTIGSMAIKAAKTIHDTLQTEQGTPQQGSAQPTQQPAPAPAQPVQAAPPPVQPPPPVQQPAPQGNVETLFCDQCGARVRPGKRFCNQCGAQLP
jgi:hypothetical protein